MITFTSVYPNSMDRQDTLKKKTKKKKRENIAKILIFKYFEQKNKLRIPNELISKIFELLQPGVIKPIFLQAKDVFLFSATTEADAKGGAKRS